MEWIRKLVCKVFGHKKPYIEKFTAKLCPRCRVVVATQGPIKVSLAQLKKRHERLKKRGF